MSNQWKIEKDAIMIKKETSSLNLEQLKQAFKFRMEQLYGDRLAEVLLYGSYARGDFHEESDVDFMVVLKDEKLVGLKEVRNISVATYDLILKYGVLISSIPTTLHKMATSQMPLYINVRKDALPL